jgi:HlyD family secretion protein
MGDKVSMSTSLTLTGADLVARPPKSPLTMARGIAVAGLGIVVLFIGVLGVWSAFAPLESAAIGPGTVEAETSRKTIQHLEGGIIGEILVKDGDHVHTGQTLIRLDDTKPRTTLAALQGQYWDALAREARLIAERDGRDTITWPERLDLLRGDPTVAQVLLGQEKIFLARHELFESKRQVIEQRIAQVKEEITGYQAQLDAARSRIALIQEEIKGAKELADKGLERKPRLLQLQRDHAEIEGQRGELIAQIAKAQQTIAESEVQILNQQNDNQNEVANQLRDTQQKIHELSEQMQAAADVLTRIEVKSPQDGIVTDMKVHTKGGVIQAGEPLMDLVPAKDNLIVTVQVRPEDINVVREGLPAQVRLIPYKTRRTPQIDGKVIYVSADKLTDKRTNHDYYAAKVRLDSDELAKLAGEVELYPGMPAEAMIKTGETTVALYALSPILDSFHRAFHEK